MKSSEILMNALDIIDTPGKWTTHEWARAEIGDTLVGVYDITKYEPTCFCSVGALKYVSGITNMAVVNEQFIHALQYLGLVPASLCSTVAIVNDSSKTPFDREISEMWLSAIFCALADGN
jgi:hypothetical protein